MAVITGNFPLPVPLVELTDGGVGYWKKTGDSAVFTAFNAVSGFGEAEFLVEELGNRLYNLTNYRYANDFNWTHIGPYAIKQSGNPTPNPPDKILYGAVTAVNNKPFRKRVARGEMVVSNYQRLNAYLKYRNGGAEIILGPPFKVDRYWQIVNYVDGWSEPQWLKKALGGLNGYGACPADSTIAIGQSVGGGTSPFFRQMYQNKSMTDEVSPYSVGWDDSIIQAFLNKGINDIVEDDLLNEVVTATIAEANKRTVDMLTALAEGPETVISIKNAVMEVIRLFKDARNGHLRIINSAKRVQREHEARVHRINFTSNQEWLAARNARTRRNIEHKRQQAIAQSRRDLALAIKEFTDAVTQVWLTFRYGIMPNVYLVEDLIKAQTEPFQEFVRSGQRRTVRIEPPTMPGWETTGEIYGVIRCFNKRKFEATAIASKEYSFNIAVTLWELVPLSFVIDWFVNVGDVLSVLFGGTNEYVEASTISVKLENAPITYRHTRSGATVNVDFRGYSRKVINPLHYCALRWDPWVDLQRQRDAASLSYQIFIKDAVKGLINRT